MVYQVAAIATGDEAQRRRVIAALELGVAHPDVFFGLDY
jgi:hypothetical protein